VSRNDWEAGDLTFSVKEFSRFRKAFYEKYNRMRAEDYVTATKVYQAMLAAGKQARRGVDWSAVFAAVTGQTRPSRWLGATELVYALKTLGRYELETLLLFDRISTPDGTRRLERRKRPRAPRKADFRPASTTRDMVFEMEGGTVTFRPATRTIRWAVAESNRAVESARESALGRLFFELLRTVQWTRGTGGTLVGNDEYNRDNLAESGGGNYVTARYGPRGESPSLPRRRTVRR